jgi:aspartyl/asparaginyl-tRNA synthetase
MKKEKFSEYEFSEIMDLYTVIYTMLEVDQMGHPNMSPDQLSPLYTAISYMYLEETYDVEKIGKKIRDLYNQKYFDNPDTASVYDYIILEILERDGTMIKDGW